VDVDRGRGRVRGAAGVEPSLEGLDEDRAFLGRQVVEGASTLRPMRAMASGAETAATASGESSKTATSCLSGALSAIAKRANRSDSPVSARS
jgi:hypothetical protein